MSPAPACITKKHVMMERQVRMTPKNSGADRISTLVAAALIPLIVLIRSFRSKIDK